MNKIMSVFHKWKTIFIQIPKNASSSISNRLENKTDDQGNSHSTFFDDMQTQDSELFESYFSFAVVRNPYDRFVSAYEFSSMVDDSFQKLNFDDFVKKCEYEGPNFYIHQPFYFIPQFKYITIKNIILVDEIIKFEDLNDEWPKIVKIINTKHNFTPIKSKLDVINATPNKMNKKWEDYYNEKTKDIIYNLYKKDFEIFNYEK